MVYIDDKIPWSLGNQPFVPTDVSNSQNSQPSGPDIVDENGVSIRHKLSKEDFEYLTNNWDAYVSGLAASGYPTKYRLVGVQSPATPESPASVAQTVATQGTLPSPSGQFTKVGSYFEWYGDNQDPKSLTNEQLQGLINYKIARNEPITGLITERAGRQMAGNWTYGMWKGFNPENSAVTSPSQPDYSQITPNVIANQGQPAANTPAPVPIPPQRTVQPPTSPAFSEDIVTNEGYVPGNAAKGVVTYMYDGKLHVINNPNQDIDQVIRNLRGLGATQITYDGKRVDSGPAPAVSRGLPPEKAANIARNVATKRSSADRYNSVLSAPTGNGSVQLVGENTDNSRNNWLNNAGRSYLNMVGTGIAGPVVWQALMNTYSTYRNLLGRKVPRL